MDLPKGIVEDDKRIYELLANEERLHIDGIILIWRLYTTTNKKLQDPTARRLENFWWHIWGSDRRTLSPKTIAAMWQHIAAGPTVVPLKGPANRFEPPAPPPPQPSSNSAEDKSPDVEEVIVPGGLPKAVPETSEAVPSPTLKGLSASSSRPPPPHPILKKSRGDSKSGPRPTARFASPPDSEEDADDAASKASESNSSESTAGDGLEIPVSGGAAISPNKSSARRRTGTPTKRFVATTASKRRPVLPRRQSSQSSSNGSSEVVSRAGGSSAGSRYSSSSQQGSLTSNAERHGETPPQMSAKARGKQPAYKGSPSTNNIRLAEVIESPIRSLSQTSHPPLQSVQEGKQMNGYAAAAPTSAPQAAQASPLIDTPATPGSHGMERSRSHGEPPRPRPTSIGRVSSYGLLSNATSSTSRVAAYGQLSATDDLDLQALHARAAAEPPLSPGLPRTSSSASLFAPTIASPTPSVPLARPRSQLSLLLEKDSAKGRPPLKVRSKS